MRYFGFTTRDKLILQNIPICSDASVLEIGVGEGSTAKKIIGKVREFCGVDISEENINTLDSVYSNHNSVSMRCLDAGTDAALGKKFDIIYSADTLEHVNNPYGFFTFIKRHLTTNGVVVITFPNEPENGHHGVTWFNSKNDLASLANKADLKIIDFYEVRQSLWHRLIKRYFWELPKNLISRQKNNASPQTFDETANFKINQEGGIKSIVFESYARIITTLSSFFPLYKYFYANECIDNKRLLLRLTHS